MNSNVTSCPICAQNKTHTKGERIKGDSVSYDMWQCEECGSEFAMPRQAASSEYYEYETPVLRWEFEVVAKYLAENNIQTNVLDVGCADGSFVGLLRAYGIEAQGIDFNKD